MIDLDNGLYVEISPDLRIAVFAPASLGGKSYLGLIGSGEIAGRGDAIRWDRRPDGLSDLDLDALNNAIIQVTMENDNEEA